MQGTAEPGFVRKKRKFLYRMKHATPDDGATSLDSCFADLRPQAVCLDKSAATVSDPATLRSEALYAYGDVHIQTGSRMIFQWHPKYASQVLPFAIPRMVSGPDYYPDREWRRSRQDRPTVRPSVVQ